jgi:hypothetical protein
VTKATLFVGLRPTRPPAPSSGEDLRLRWQTAWYLPRSTRTSPLRGAVNGPGQSHVAIFIPQGWPQAMSHLPWIWTPAPCLRASSRLRRHRRSCSYGLSCHRWAYIDARLGDARSVATGGGAETMLAVLACGYPLRAISLSAGAAVCSSRV